MSARKNRPAFEKLEVRQMLSASLTDTGRLIITGDAVNPNVITVGLNANGSSVDVIENGGAVQAFNASAVSNVIIVGGNGNDTITIDESNHPFAINTKIFGEGGADSITGGSGNEFISGGAGADTIFAGSGNDTVIGGGGGDAITDAAGNGVRHVLRRRS